MSKQTCDGCGIEHDPMDWHAEQLHDEYACVREALQTARSKLQASVDAHNQIFEALRECEEKRNAQSLRLDSLSEAVKVAWFSKREGDMWKALGRAMDIVDPSRTVVETPTAETLGDATVGGVPIERRGEIDVSELTLQYVLKQLREAESKADPEGYLVSAHMAGRLATFLETFKQDAADARAELTAAVSPEVCNAAHDNVTTCGYCQRDEAHGLLLRLVEWSTPRRLKGLNTLAQIVHAAEHHLSRNRDTWKT